MRNSVIPVITFLLVLLSCTSKPVFENNVALPDAVWNRFNSLKFDVNIENPGVYDVTVVIVYDTTYAYSNLSIDFTYYGNDSESRTRPHSINLKNSDGVFSGDKIENGFYKYTYQTFSALNIQNSGTIAFEIDNVMPVFDLKGVHSAGIVVRKHKPDRSKNS
jgi:gliding motility-associated lipoprotein GldH